MKGVDIAKCGQILRLRTHVAGRVESRFFATMGMPGSAMRALGAPSTTSTVCSSGEASMR